jgi:CRISPR-associated protein Cmr2
MPDAVLTFTFSPVQPFIAEARRAADLYAGSRILVELAKAAARAVADAGGDLVYPAALNGDIPNKLVAVVPWDRARTIAERAERALREQWAAIAASARRELERLGPAPDRVWTEIWQRQAAGPWEVYWAAAAFANGNATHAYAAAYRKAERALAAAKRTRAFSQAEEPGLKDTLSGRRSALRTGQFDARAYWAAVARHPAVTAAKLRPAGRERLDTLGAVKRFADIARQGFLSTSGVATADFLSRARAQAADALHAYRRAVQALLGEHAYPVRSDQDWPYDGDLFYQETLTPGSLADRYTLLNPDATALERARAQLRGLHKAAGSPPSPYYGIVVLDGDDMGKRIGDRLNEQNPLAAHRDLGRCLSDFAATVRPLAEGDRYRASVIYTGGDDVLLLAPLTTALSVAQALAEEFERKTRGTASAGIAVVHHFYPLDAALAAARAAEWLAKDVDGKAAVCVRVLKRSGETTDMRSRWQDLGTTFADLVRLFTEDGAGQPLASRFPYDVAASAYGLTIPDDRFQAELCRLLTRHRNGQHPAAPDPAQWAGRLTDWARRLPHPDAGAVTDELARWLVFARFVAQGGGE